MTTIIGFLFSILFWVATFRHGRRMLDGKDTRQKVINGLLALFYFSMATSYPSYLWLRAIILYFTFKEEWPIWFDMAQHLFQKHIADPLIKKAHNNHKK